MHTRTHIRAANARAKARRDRKLEVLWRDPNAGADCKLLGRYGYPYRDRKPCSCHLCGNPRRHYGTRAPQDLRDEQRWREGA